VGVVSRFALQSNLRNRYIISNLNNSLATVVPPVAAFNGNGIHYLDGITILTIFGREKNIPCSSVIYVVPI
jgi:hypothetical protein